MALMKKSWTIERKTGRTVKILTESALVWTVLSSL